MSNQERYRLIRAGLILEGSSIPNVAKELGFHRFYVREVAIGNRRNVKIEERLNQSIHRARQAFSN